MRSTTILKCVILVIVCTWSFGANAQKFNELAQTPPMGWNSWNEFGCDVNEELIRSTADAMVESGMAAVGYEYVNIDDCWHGERDAGGNIQANPENSLQG